MSFTGNAINGGSDYCSVDPERCQLQHSLFLRSVDPKKEKGKYKYECQLCNLPPIYADEEIKQETHPLCAQGNHHLYNACDMGCCGIACASCEFRYRPTPKGSPGYRMAQTIDELVMTYLASCRAEFHTSQPPPITLPPYSGEVLRIVPEPPKKGDTQK